MSDGFKDEVAVQYMFKCDILQLHWPDFPVNARLPDQVAHLLLLHLSFTAEFVFL